MTLKILILSDTAWNTDNSFGNTFSNFFDNIKGLEIANIYCSYGVPKNNIVNNYFQITEKSLLINLMNKKIPSGRELTDLDCANHLNKTENKLFNHARKKRLQMYFWVRDFIWKIGRWKSSELQKFISDFGPDIVFQPIYYSNYLNDIALFIKEFTNVPMVGYIGDDIYTLQQFSLSPLYWINRFMIREKVKKVVGKCNYIYVVSDIQKKEYEKIFNIDCKILRKGAEFSDKPRLKRVYEKPIKLIYTGNIYAGRWKVLSSIGEALEKINSNSLSAKLFIYTMTPMTKKMKKHLTMNENIVMMGGVPSSEIKHIQNEADILVHVESFDLKEKLLVRQSFSTKIIDYLTAAKCIFAVGDKSIASIKYLAMNDAAVIAFSEKAVYLKLKEIIEDNNKLLEYGEKAWNCGKHNHQIDSIQSKLYKDLHALAKES